MEVNILQRTVSAATAPHLVKVKVVTHWFTVTPAIKIEVAVYTHLFSCTAVGVPAPAAPTAPRRTVAITSAAAGTSLGAVIATWAGFAITLSLRLVRRTDLGSTTTVVPAPTTPAAPAGAAAITGSTTRSGACAYITTWTCT